jgi:hypothetical protein
MDGQRFDTLAKSIGALRSRRRVVTALSGAALAGALGLGGREAAAAPKPANAKCSSDTQCASGTCIRYDKCKKNGKFTGKCRCACSATNECPTGQTCSNQPDEVGACFPQCPSPGSCATEFIFCASKLRCMCVATDIGPSCVNNGVVCSTVKACTTKADCPVGQACGDFVDACRCGEAQYCLNPCGVGEKIPQTSP